VQTTATSFPLSKHTGGGDIAPTFSGLLFVYSSRGRWVFPCSPVEFSSLCHSHKLSSSWLLGTCCRSHPLWPGLAYLFTVLGGIIFPPSSVLREPHPLCYMSLSFLLIITQFLFSFPGCGSVCPGGYADLAQGCLWKYCMPLSSPCLHLPNPSERGRLAAHRPSWLLHLT
jgi:hypothetical protein